MSSTLCDRSSSNLPSNVTLERQKKRKKEKRNSNCKIGIFAEIVDRGTPFDGIPSHSLSSCRSWHESYLEQRSFVSIPSLPPFFSRPIYSISLPLSVGRGRIQKREAASIKKKKTNILLQYAFAIIIISVCTCRSFFFFFFLFFLFFPFSFLRVCVCVIARVSIQRFIRIQ